MNGNIELKLQLSHNDVHFLRNLIVDAANLKINFHLPFQNQTEKDESRQLEDPMRDQVKELVHQFVYDTFEMARYGLVVDGTDISKKSASLAQTLKEMEDDNIEPFDQEINDELKDTYALVDELILEISNIRQKVPHEILKIYANSLKGSKQFNQKHETDVLVNFVKDEDIIKQNIKCLQEEYYKNLEQFKNLKKSEVPEASIYSERLEKTLEFFKQ